MWHNKYMKIPFVEKGRDENGCDCWGLVCLIYKNELGIKLKSRSEDYSDTNNVETVNGTINNERMEWEDVTKPDMFDVVILSMRGLPMHVGLMVDGKHMIHCQRGVGTCFERLDTLRWKNKVVGYSRWKR